MFSLCFAASHHAARVAWRARSPGTPLIISATVALNCVCEHLCCSSIYFVHLLAGSAKPKRSFFGSGRAQNDFPYKLTEVALLYTILVYEVFIGMLYFQIVGETCIGNIICCNL